MPSSKPYWNNFWQLQLHDGRAFGFISPREANERMARGDGKRIRRKAHQPFEIFRLNKPIPPSDSPESPACLTVTDMRINAGEIECGRSYLVILRAKIESFRPTFVVVPA